MEEGEHDFVLEGRGANVIYVTSTDGDKMSPKKVLLKNSDYPSFCSCHVRDPKVWTENGKYRMVLGARTVDDKGCVLLYEGASPDSLEYKDCLSVPDMGYMWECPDMFELDGEKFLALCPQGIARGEYRMQNIFQSGYFTVNGESLEDFEEFDYGFDFYAPQTFKAPDGRRILIGWMGIGDDSYSNPTAESGWQHCLTLPRELSVGPDGKILQNPIRELDSLKKDSKKIEGEAWEGLPFEINASGFTDNAEICISGASIKWEKKSGVLSLKLNEEGYGRNVRKILTDDLTSLRIIADKSSLEIYINGGRYVMSTRFYPEYNQVRIGVSGADAELSRLRLNDTLVSIGEALIDFIPDRKGCGFHEVGSFSPATGGAPANVCGAFSRLGGKARMITQLGSDPFGEVITRTLNEAGVDTSCISYTSEANTALAFVSHDQAGKSTYSFYRNPSADMLFDPSSVTADMLDDCYALHFCSVSLGDFPMKDAHRAAIAIARRQGAIISFDPNLRFMLWEDKDELKRVIWKFLPDADILKISDEELEFIAGTTDIDEALPVLFTGNVKLVIITMSKDGAMAFNGHGKVSSSCPPVNAVDTTGAGDGFIGSFLWKLKSLGVGKDELASCPVNVVSACLDFANRFSSISVQRKGAIPSYPDLKELMEKESEK